MANSLGVNMETSQSHSSLAAFENANEAIISLRDRFNAFKPRWIDDPIITQWRSPKHGIYNTIAEADRLHTRWKRIVQPLFARQPSPLWLDTGRVMAELGLPWYTNSLNMPDEIDTSWVFHFKDFESNLLGIMGARVGDPRPSGYVCSYQEANCYCIRALQQHFRVVVPNQKPVLVYDNFDNDLIKAFHAFFGLETCHLDLTMPQQHLETILNSLTDSNTRPIIFAATVGNSIQYDNLELLSELSKSFHIMLHLDAFRSFGYITTLSSKEKRREGVEAFRLGVVDLGESLKRESDGSILAGTIVAGSLCHSQSAPAAALRSALLLSGDTRRVAYIRSFDSTLGGSRDGMAPLWMALYETRLGEAGLSQLCQHLTDLRDDTLLALRAAGDAAHTVPYTWDILVTPRNESRRQLLLQLGGISSESNTVILSVSPSLSSERIAACVLGSHIWNDHGSSQERNVPYRDFTQLYPIPHRFLESLKARIARWGLASRRAIGYPFYMGSLSALGPIIGAFWNVVIPQSWIKQTSQQLLLQRLRSFGVEEHDLGRFKGSFTNGSTMGNRCGIYSALSLFPDAHIYLSADTHYSVIKILQDCDDVTGLWTGGNSRYSVVPSTDQGVICVDSLVQQAVADKKRAGHGAYQLILFANCGTTFTGARDDLGEIMTALQKQDITISYIHVDGAFDFGYDTCGIHLGPPGSTDETGRPLVQGITLSHHKAMGQSVSGEVLCYNPDAESTLDLCDSTDPRLVLETWLYGQVFSAQDVASMQSNCLDKADQLREMLRSRGIITKSKNAGSTTVVLERPPAWIIEEFSLRPEGGWVHFVVMPNISRQMFDFFLDEIDMVDKACHYAFEDILSSLEDCAQRNLHLRRVSCQSTLARAIISLIAREHEDEMSIIKSMLRGSLCIAALDQLNQVQCVFLSKSGRDRTALAGPLLISNNLSHCQDSMELVGRQLISLVAHYLKIEIREDQRSYQHLYYVSSF